MEHSGAKTGEAKIVEVFTLRVFGELSYEKIGAIFGHTANWACVTYCRAKRKIQQMLKEA